MRTNLLLIGAALSAALLTIARAQNTPGGINTEGALSLESQVAGPSGQTDFQTDLFTGRFGYSFPFPLSPARHESAPKIGLRYNSANPNGWCGVGWDIDLGYIERETKYGVPVVWQGGQCQKKYDDTKGFVFAFKNKVSDFVSVGNNTYRAQIENDFLRFQLDPTGNKWTVTDTSGNQYVFGSSAASQMLNPKSGWATGEQGTFRWALDTVTTATGDKSSITYSTAAGKLYPQTYTYNGATGISPSYKVNFYLTSTPRPDATISCRSGYAVTNLYLLNAVTHTVGGMMVWSNRLTFTNSSSTGRSLLASIVHYGTNLSASLPPVTFGYTQQRFAFQSSSNWSNLGLPTGAQQYLNSYYSFNNALCDLVDMDGDGLPDRILAPWTTGSTSWWVQHNNGSNGFSAPAAWTLASQSGGGYSTASDPTWAEFGTHGRLLDINGDGRPDWVADPMDLYINGGSYTRQIVQTNNSTNLLNQSPPLSWTNVVDLFSNPYYSADGYFRAVENENPATSGNVTMLDMNGDGLPDRVMTSPGPPYNFYWVQFNTGAGYSQTNYFGPFKAQGATNYETWGGVSGANGNTGNAISLRMIDMNGDGLPDRVMLMWNPASGTVATASQTNYVVELNNGWGFEPPMNWTNVATMTSAGNGISDLGDDLQVALRDVNGDGLPDRILACWANSGPYTNWLVQLNTGMGFAAPINWGPVNSQSQTANLNYCGIQYATGSGAVGGTGYTMLLDMNGDGLPDRVELAYNATPQPYYVVELSSGPFPDLLSTASNGLGGVVTAAYKPSTQYDNRESTNSTPVRYLLPFPIYTVSALNVGDGINSLASTTYKYTGGYWNSTLKQFDGFAQTTVTDPLGASATHWFHQAGGRNNAAYGEYNDSTANIGKVGMEFRTDLMGTNGESYRTALNKVEEKLLNGVQHFAYVATNVTVDYAPALSTAYRATARQYQYDTVTGNLTNTLDYGQVTNVTASAEAFSDIGNDDVYQITHFAKLSANTNIIDKLQSVTVSTDSLGNGILRQRLFAYDSTAAANLLQTLDTICVVSGVPQYRTNSYTYDIYNNTQSHTIPSGVTERTTYDTTYQTYPTQITLGGLLNTFTTYDPRSGDLSQATDPNGWVTVRLYDPFLRPIENDSSHTSNGPTAWLQKYSYTLGASSGPQNSILAQESDNVDSVNGHQSISWFDGLGRIVQNRTESETSGTYRVTDTAYDPRGNLAFVSFPYFNSSGSAHTLPASGLGVFRGYDPIGRLNQSTASMSAVFNNSGQLTSLSGPSGDVGSPVGSSSIVYDYHNDPFTVASVDETGKTTLFSVDAYGRTNQVTEITSQGSYATTFTWNPAGDLLGVIDAANNQIQYSNNLLGEVVAMADPDIGVWQYERDWAGRVHHQIDGNGQRTDYNYTNDPLGRLVGRQVYDLKGNFYNGVTNIYDSNGGDANFPVAPGQLFETLDSEGYSKFGYDVRARKTITARHVSVNGATYTNRYTYDDMGRLRSIAYPNGGPIITNVYDAGAHIAKVQLFGGAGTTFYNASQFTALDQIQTIGYGNGLSTSYAYYPNSKRLQTIGAGTSLQNLTYAYDAAANITSIADGVNPTGAASASISSASYDDLHRLISVTRPTGNSSYGYDATGNVTTNTDNGSGAYNYGNRLPHAVKTANGLNYAYDLCGNMLVRGHQSLVYNPENRLIAAAASNRVTTFGYAADGTRLWKQGPGTNALQIWIGGSYEEKDGKILYHITAGNRIVYTYSSDGSVAEYYHPDHIHSAQLLTTTGGALYQHYEYATYGSSRYVYNSAVFPVSSRYTSQILDDETGLYYYGARYYDPQLGRFIQPDSLILHPFDPQAYDRYAYARDNPLLYVDPSGHWEFPSWSYNWIPSSWVGFFGSTSAIQPTAPASGTSPPQNNLALLQRELGGYDSSELNAAGRAMHTVAEMNPVLSTFNSGYATVTGNNAEDPALSLTRGERIQAAGATAADLLAAATWEMQSGASVWEAAPLTRGRLIEQSLGANLAQNFPVIDRFVDGVATSIKSIDLTAASYQDMSTLASKLNSYVDSVANFQGAVWGSEEVSATDVTSRELQLAIPPGGPTPEQQAVIDAATARAADMGVTIVVTEVQ